MKLASLFSGGKDSMYALYMAQKQGHKITSLLSIFAKSDESHLLHHPNIQWTKLQSESMKIPQLTITSDSDKTDDELDILEKLLQQAKKQFGISGVVHGGIKSRFQKEKFKAVCSKLDLDVLSPLWNITPKQYLNDLLDSNFDFIMTSVSSDGLDDTWLGRLISKHDVGTLSVLSKKFGFNLDFEGGEAETFVVNCPLFSNPIHIAKSQKTWDGYRGKFEIVEAQLNCNA